MDATPIEGLLIRLGQLEDHLALCMRQREEARVMAIPPEVAAAFDTIDAAMLPQIQELGQAVQQAKEEIRRAVLGLGASVKAYGYQAVYTRGRISWDDAWLQGYAASHDEILQARIEGQPSVSIRKAK